MHIVLYVLHCCIFACICYIADDFLNVFQISINQASIKIRFWDFFFSCLIAINSPDYVEHVYSVSAYKGVVRHEKEHVKHGCVGDEN